MTVTGDGRLSHYVIPQVAGRIERAVSSVLDQGYRTGDMMSPGMTLTRCSKLGDILEQQVTEAVSAGVS